MTRTKEPAIGTSEVPDYKSPPSRIIRSLRTAYDNLREKLANKSEIVQSLQGKLRDTQVSRDEWKSRAKAAEIQLEEALQKSQLQEKGIKKRG